MPQRCFRREMSRRKVRVMGGKDEPIFCFKRKSFFKIFHSGPAGAVARPAGSPAEKRAAVSVQPSPVLRLLFRTERRLAWDQKPRIDRQGPGPFPFISSRRRGGSDPPCRAEDRFLPDQHPDGDRPGGSEEKDRAVDPGPLSDLLPRSATSGSGSSPPLPGSPAHAG